MHAPKRILTSALSVLALVAFSGFALAEAPAPAPPAPPVPAPPVQAAPAAPQEWAILPCLPAESALVLSIKDVQGAYQKFQKTGLGQLAFSQEVSDVFRGPLIAAKGGLWLAEQRFGYKLADLLNSFQGELTVGLLGLLEQRNERGEPIPDLVVAFQPRGQADAWMQTVQKFVDQLNGQAGGQLLVKQAQFGGATVQTLSLPGQPVQLSYTFCDGVFLAALNQGRLEGILAARQATLAAPRNEAKTLSAQPAFQHALAKLGPSPDLLLYANVGALRKVPEFNLQPKNEKDKANVERLGLNALLAVSYGLTFRDNGISEAFFFDCPAEGRKGLFNLLDNAPLKPEAFSLAPQNAVAAFAWQLAPEDLLEKLIDLATVFEPHARGDIEPVLNQLGQELGLDVRKDFLGAFTGQMVFSLAFPSKHPKLGFGFPQPILRLGTKDPASTLRVMTAFKRMGKDTHQYSDLTHGDKTIVVARESRVLEGRDPGQICWVQASDQLLVSLFPLALRDELDRMKAAATPEAAAANLTADADFRAVRGQLGSDQQIVTYMDVRAVATAAYDFLVPLGQLNPRGRPANVNLDLLPTSVALARHLGGIAIGVHTDAAGIKLESYSATGFWSTLAPVAALAIQAAQRAGRQARGALAAAGETAEQAQRRQQLRDTYRFLNAYAQDHQGQYPAKLADLMPNYVKPEAAQKAPEITYLGKQDAPNKVLAHMNPAKPGDPSPVLLQDGHVHMVAADQLELVLKEGFKEEAAPPAAGAVKPPVPPPDF